MFGATDPDVKADPLRQFHFSDRAETAQISVLVFADAQRPIARGKTIEGVRGQPIEVRSMAGGRATAFEWVELGERVVVYTAGVDEPVALRIIATLKRL